MSLLEAPREVVLHPSCVTPLTSGSPEHCQASLPGGEWAALGCGAERGETGCPQPVLYLLPGWLPGFIVARLLLSYPPPPSPKVIKQLSIHHPDAIAQMNVT